MLSRQYRFNRKEERLNLLHKFGVELISSKKLDEVLKKTVETAAFIVEEEEAVLLLFDENNDKLSLRAIRTRNEETAKILDEEISVPQKISSLDNDQVEMISSKAIEQVIGSLPKSLLCIPLRSEEEVSGYLCLYNFEKKVGLSKEDEELLSILSNYAAIGIKNTSLFKDMLLKAETFSGLYNVSQSMLSEVNLDKLLEIIADNALKVLEADIVVLYEYVGKKDDFEIPPILKGLDIKSPEILKVRGKKHNASLIMKIVNRDNPFYAPKARQGWNGLLKGGHKLSKAKNDFISRESIVSSAGIPLHIGGETVGIMFINYRSYQPFNHLHRMRIEAFANQAALAIRNAKIFAQRERSINEFSVLTKIIQKISSAVTLNIDEILNLIYKQTSRLMDVTNFYVAFYDKNTKMVSFQFAVEEGRKQETGSGQFGRRKEGNGLTEYVIRTGKALLIRDNAEKWIHDHKIDSIGTPAESWLGAPMMLENEVLGVIVTQSPDKESAYDEGNRNFLGAIASQAAIAIDKARLFQESQKQLNELNSLYTISQEIASKSMDIIPVLNTILERAVQITNVDAGQILFYDDTTEIFKVVLTYNMDMLQGKVIETGEGMVGRVVAEKKAIFTNDYFNYPHKSRGLDKPEFRELIKGIMQVPLIWQDKLLGVLSLSTRPGNLRNFSDKDVEQLNHFAGSASLAIAIARDISFQKTLLNDNPDAIIAVNRKGIITEFNRASEHIMNIRKEEIIEKNVLNLYYEGKKEAQRINHLLREHEERGELVKNITTAVKGKSGERIPILFSGGILRNELNERIGSIGIMTDLREIKLLDEEYRSQQTFLTIIEQYPQDEQIITQEDLQRRLTKILALVCSFCKVDYIILFASTAEDENVLKTIAWQGLPADIEKGLPHFNWRKAKLLEEGKSKEVSLNRETDLINKWLPDDEWEETVLLGIRGHNKEFFHNLSCGVPVRLADNYRAVLVFGPFEDKTNLLEIADFVRNVARSICINALSWLQALYLRSRNKDSERARKLIVHRTKMHLQQIMGKFGLIKSSEGVESQVKENAAYGEWLVEHLSRIVTRSLTSQFAEMEEGDFVFQEYPLAALIQNCVENFQERAIFWNRELRLDPRVEYLPYAIVDPLILSVALNNIIENALKYSYKGTFIKVYSEYDTKKATIIVQNVGEQMSEDAKKNLLQPGKRWGMSARARNTPGTGFGLWDASIITVAHGGQLEFTSVPTKNDKEKSAYLVRVWITLPLKREEVVEIIKPEVKNGSKT